MYCYICNILNLVVSAKFQILLPVTIFAVLIGIVGMMLIQDSKLSNVELHMGLISIDDILIEVSIANNNSEYIQGMMFKDQLNKNEGMFFIFDNSTIHKIWTLNMQFPIDIIWFDENKHIIHIEENIQPCKSVIENILCDKNGPEIPSKYILEVNQGFINKFNINENSQLVILDS